MFSLIAWLAASLNIASEAAGPLALLPDQGILIDDFAAGVFGPFNSQQKPFGYLEVTIPAGHSLTGQRVVGAHDPGEMVSYVSLQNGDDYLLYMRASRGAGLVYYGVDERREPLGLHIDLSAANAFRIALTAPGPHRFIIQAEDHAGQGRGMERILPGSGIYYFLFEEFGPVQAKINWKDLARINFGVATGLDLNKDTLGEFRFHHFSAIVYPPPAPVILQQPAGIAARAGDAASLTVVARGLDIRFQWSKDGAPLSGATNPVLSFPAVRIENVGEYRVRVTNEGGSIESAIAPLVLENKLKQTISFQVIGDRLFGDEPIPLRAVASSGMPVLFEVVSGPANVVGNDLVLKGVGAVEVRATQPGNDLYDAATAAQTLNVGVPNVLVQTLAGNGVAGYLDAFVPTSGMLNAPDGPSVGPDGRIYFADVGNNAIRYIDPIGPMKTLAGAGRVGNFDAFGTNALFSYPLATRTLRNGSILVADAENDVIRRIDPRTSEVTTFSGNGARGFLNGDAKTARYAFPTDLVEGPDGAIYVTEFQNHIVRKVLPDGSTETLAGNGVAGFADGVGANAQLNQPAGLALGPDGNLYVSDWGNHRIRKVTPRATVTTLAGSGTGGLRDGSGHTALFNNPNGIVAGAKGELYVTENQNHTIRKIAPDGFVTTVAGLGRPGFGDGNEKVALFNGPSGIALLGNGDLLVTDSRNNRVRHLTFPLKPAALSVESIASFDGGSRGFKFHLTGERDAEVVIETSFDLKVWKVANTIRLDSAGSFEGVGFAGEKELFYRGRTLPR